MHEQKQEDTLKGKKNDNKECTRECQKEAKGQNKG